MDFWLTKIEWQDDLTRDLLLSFTSEGGVTRQVRCCSVEELHVEQHQPLEVGQIPKPVRDHPLLWPYTQCPCDLYFTAGPADPHAVIGRLAAAHDALVGAWIPFSRWFSQKDVSPQVELLRSGTGCFASGPQQVMELYRDVLASHGCRPSLLRAGPQAEATDEEIRACYKLAALILCPGVYVLAESFEEREP